MSTSELVTDLTDVDAGSHDDSKPSPSGRDARRFVRVNGSDGVTAGVVQHVQSLIERGEVPPGGQLPPERELAVQLGVSRTTVRSALRSLAAIGVLQIRQGAGTFVTDGPPRLVTEPLRFLAAVQGFTRDEMREAGEALEASVTRLAAKRATDERLVSIAEEVVGMFASFDNPQAFLAHELRFHQAVASASGNRVLTSLAEMVRVLAADERRTTIHDDLKQSADRHREIYRAIRAHDPQHACGQTR